MPTAFLLMDSTYGTDDRCHDDSSELGSIAWLFLYTYVITCVCSTSAARSPPPCSAAAAVLVITHVLFIQLPHKYLLKTLSSQPGSLAPGHWPCQGRSRLLLVMGNHSTGLHLCGGPATECCKDFFGLVNPDTLSPELRLMETRSNNHLERDTLPPATVALRRSIATPLSTWNQMNPEFETMGNRYC